MSSCCETCSKLDKHNKCSVIENFMLVMVRIFDGDFADVSSTFSKDQSLIVKDKALKTFCCNQYEEKNSQEGGN